MQFKAPPFLRCGIAFHGFSEEDLKEMEEMAMNNGKPFDSNSVIGKEYFLLRVIVFNLQEIFDIWQYGYAAFIWNHNLVNDKY